MYVPDGRSAPQRARQTTHPPTNRLAEQSSVLRDRARGPRERHADARAIVAAAELVPLASAHG